MRVPDQLIQARESGRVGFFCDGVSNPAGLPGFNGLVTQLYAQIGGMMNASKEQSFDKASINELDAETLAMVFNVASAGPRIRRGCRVRVRRVQVRGERIVGRRRGCRRPMR